MSLLPGFMCISDWLSDLRASQFSGGEVVRVQIDVEVVSDAKGLLALSGVTGALYIYLGVSYQNTENWEVLTVSVQETRCKARPLSFRRKAVRRDPAASAPG